jgi:hypothetical protein
MHGQSCWQPHHAVHGHFLGSILSPTLLRGIGLPVSCILAISTAHTSSNPSDFLHDLTGIYGSRRDGHAPNVELCIGAIRGDASARSDTYSSVQVCAEHSMSTPTYSIILVSSVLFPPVPQVYIKPFTDMSTQSQG